MHSMTSLRIDRQRAVCRLPQGVALLVAAMACGNPADSLLLLMRRLVMLCMGAAGREGRECPGGRPPGRCSRQLHWHRPPATAGPGGLPCRHPCSPDAKTTPAVQALADAIKYSGRPWDEVPGLVALALCQLAKKGQSESCTPAHLACVGDMQDELVDMIRIGQSLPAGTVLAPSRPAFCRPGGGARAMVR